HSLDDICHAISTLSVRGAPAIGITGAMGLVVVVAECAALSHESFSARCREVAARIRATRPTAVSLGWPLVRMLAWLARERTASSMTASLRAESTAILDEDRAMCRSIGEHGASLIPDGARVITHCNAGALATVGIGTALAALYVAHERGK